MSRQSLPGPLVLRRRCQSGHCGSSLGAGRRHGAARPATQGHRATQGRAPTPCGRPPPHPSSGATKGPEMRCFSSEHPKRGTWHLWASSQQAVTVESWGRGLSPVGSADRVVSVMGGAGRLEDGGQVRPLPLLGQGSWQGTGGPRMPSCLEWDPTVQEAGALRSECMFSHQLHPLEYCCQPCQGWGSPACPHPCLSLTLAVPIGSRNQADPLSRNKGGGDMERAELTSLVSSQVPPGLLLVKGRLLLRVLTRVPLGKGKVIWVLGFVF